MLQQARDRASLSRSADLSTGTTFVPSFDPAAVGILVTGLVLGIRHGIDWDHIAAITDITSTTAAAGVAEAAHAGAAPA